MKWTEIIAILLGTGIITTLAQILLTNNLNKRFFRFSNLYKDKLDIIREFYKLLIKAEKGLNILMIESEPELKFGKDGIVDQESSRKSEEFNIKTYGAINSFFDFYDQNEIIFEDEIVILVNQLREKFIKANNAQSFAKIMEASRPSKAWENSVQEKQDTYETIVKKDIPCLKRELKTLFQERYKLLETN